jgi:tryptophan halogenase
MIQNVLVVGAGSAGLIAALSLKRKIPQLNVRIVRSPELGTIGVGEGTTPNFPDHLFNFLGISRKHFYAAAQPTWKLGIRFLWGPRPRFDYGFGHALDAHWSDLPRPNGFYCDEEFRNTDLCTALMFHDRAFLRQPDGVAPDVHQWFGFHIENKLLVETLENVATHAGVEIIDGKVSGVERTPGGDDDEQNPRLAAVVLDDGRRLAADLFIDASGFRSELLGKALGEPYVSYADALLCDRAVVGGWDRGPDEPILPYTTAETMDAGWAWRIDHERHVNRGYVYCSSAISDEDAAAEFKRKNPKTPENPRIVKFRSGRYRRGWVGNVIGMGNACGFVEPLEATALMVVCAHSKTLVEFLLHTGLKPTPTIRELFNHWVGQSWDEIRDFLALHYKLNTRLQTPFWRQAVNDIDLKTLEPFMKFYEENGPTGFGRHLLRRETGIHFGVEGFLVMMVGNRHPYAGKYEPTPAEQALFDSRRAEFAAKARGAMDVKEALSVIRRPDWAWHE